MGDVFVPMSVATHTAHGTPVHIIGLASAPGKHCMFEVLVRPGTKYEYFNVVRAGSLKTPDLEAIPPEDRDEFKTVVFCDTQEVREEQSA